MPLKPQWLGRHFRTVGMNANRLEGLTDKFQIGFAALFH